MIQVIRIALGVMIGFGTLLVLQILALSGFYLGLGTDGTFMPNSYDLQLKWVILHTSVVFVAAVVGGLVCALISKHWIAPLLLATVILVGGLADGFAQSKKMAEPSPVREGAVELMGIAAKARMPTWASFAQPALMVIGSLIGAWRIMPLNDGSTKK